MTTPLLCFDCHQPIETHEELSIGLYVLKPRPFHMSCHAERLKKRSLKEKLFLGGPLNQRFLKDPRVSKMLSRMFIYAGLIWFVLALPLFFISGSLYVLLLGFGFGLLLIMPILGLIWFIYNRMIKSVYAFESAFEESSSESE